MTACVKGALDYFLNEPFAHCSNTVSVVYKVYSEHIYSTPVLHKQPLSHKLKAQKKCKYSLISTFLGSEL